jgi:DNA polymerase theta
MADGLGIWHNTTFHEAQEDQQDYQVLSRTRNKRTLEEEEPHESTAPDHKRASFHRASAVFKQTSRLAASGITTIAGDLSAGPSEYSQRQAFNATPSSTIDPLLSLSHRAYGLPDQLVANFAALGIGSIYPWQKQCLLGPGILTGKKNLVYSAPTGGGKSLVADVLMLKRVLQDADSKAILVLPYVALVQEKVRWLRRVVQGISRESLGQAESYQSKVWATRADKDTVRVVGFFGGSKVKLTWDDFDIAVCTFEKVIR